MTTQTVDSLKQEIEQDISANKICIFGKGTKEIPMCGFTLETKTFFEKYGHPFMIIDVLNNMEKRQLLNEMTQWQTLPKVFINGKFYGDTDILGPMEESGELQTVLKDAFGEG